MSKSKVNRPATQQAPAASARSANLGDQVRSLQLPPATASRPLYSGGLLWAVALMVSVVVIFLVARQFQGAGGEATNGADRVAEDTPRTPPEPTSVGATADDTEIALESRGYVIPAHQILVSPEVSGRLIDLKAEEGMRMAAGAVLAEIDPTEYQMDLQRAEASVELARQRFLELDHGLRPEEVAQVEAELREAQAQLVQLESQFQRSTQLQRDNAIPVDQLEQAESAFRVMQRRVDRLKLAVELANQGPRIERVLAAQAELQQYEAELAKARWRLDKCTITAPISGTILKKNAEEGNLVNPIAFNGSFSICDMADLSDLEVQLDIQERDISRIFKGQKCRVRAEAFPDRVYAGTVSRLLPIADRAKGAIPVRVKLSVPADEEGVYLKPEMAATVTFLQRDSETSPAAAVRDPDNGQARGEVAPSNVSR